jgi:hypothetical protein
MVPHYQQTNITPRHRLPLRAIRPPNRDGPGVYCGVLGPGCGISVSVLLPFSGTYEGTLCDAKGGGGADRAGMVV